ncbi:HAMP domain-containing histidine kinase [Aestuariibacter halophilus]|uniref:histidine kinase n=1 Tax=Fluctibacter halophilus TaxID=226011 RepID=A0ABS8G4J5_9ALTE|nr:HAMP domain-containing sensor histidine kinase [Aestuariibacter halophilus]MCC2615460.1 HAMP domain-containing histidine kinase [Aestuariibacter halophilus]
MDKHQTPGQIDFSSVLAAAVHDMKNSLCLLRQTIEQLARTVDPTNQKATAHLANAHYEAARLNTGLVQLLSLYRAEMENLPINVDEWFIEDVVEELISNNEVYIAHKNIAVTVDVEPHLSWFMDGDLVTLLLNDMLVNATRYASSEIRLHIYVDAGLLVIEIEDDGPGYPKNMLDATQIAMPEYDISKGRTGLGVFFARLIATAHSHGDKHGEIVLANGGSLGGSVFTLKLP